MLNLKFPNTSKVELSFDDEAIITLYSEADKFMETIIDKAFKQENRGRRDKANSIYKSGNIFYYLIYYGISIRHFIDMESKKSTSSVFPKVLEKYDLECIEKNLECLSSLYGLDYNSFWDFVKDTLGIVSDINELEECCLGISESIINGDDCKAFYVGSCESRLEPIPPYGEFKSCEFKTKEFVKSIGDNTNCN